MSDDSDDDPEGFDKEAERERLREKYADEDQRRESTRRMSDLLLKGATMTNSHCSTCGDPIFRQNGQEFCPTCSAEGEGDAAATGQTEVDASDAANAANAAGQVGPDGTRSATGGTPDAGTGDATGRAGTSDQAGANGRVDTSGAERASPEQSGHVAGQARGVADQSGGAAGQSGDDLAAARAALVEAVAGHARAGADVNDARSAADHLAAAREAAEALAALRR